MSLNGVELIQDCSIELTIGRRYGLLGQNGSGKTNFLQCLANREVLPCNASPGCSSPHLDAYRELCAARSRRLSSSCRQRVLHSR